MTWTPPTPPTPDYEVLPVVPPLSDWTYVWPSARTTDESKYVNGPDALQIASNIGFGPPVTDGLAETPLALEIGKRYMIYFKYNGASAFYQDSLNNCWMEVWVDPGDGVLVKKSTDTAQYWWGASKIFGDYRQHATLSFDAVGKTGKLRFYGKSNNLTPPPVYTGTWRWLVDDLLVVLDPNYTAVSTPATVWS